ncbi:MAG TPA: hypothetical protein VN878_03555 [Usitatibacter sp.]|nr:hypothetical protein [Usitatibacter sp.]
MTLSDIAKMTTAELDAFIAVAVKERTKRADPQPAEAPKEFEATLNPAWFVFLAGENTIFQLRHAGHGWVSVAIPPPERAHLMSLFLHHALLAPPAKGAEQLPSTVPVPPTGGGGTVH